MGPNWCAHMCLGFRSDRTLVFLLTQSFDLVSLLLIQSSILLTQSIDLLSLLLIQSSFLFLPMDSLLIQFFDIFTWLGNLVV